MTDDYVLFEYIVYEKFSMASYSSFSKLYQFFFFLVASIWTNYDVCFLWMWKLNYEKIIEVELGEQKTQT